MKVITIMFFCLFLGISKVKSQEAMIGMPQDIVVRYLQNDQAFHLTGIDGPIQGYIIVSYKDSQTGDEKTFCFSKGVCVSYTYGALIDRLPSYIKNVEINYHKINDNLWVEKNNTFDLQIHQLGSSAFQAMYTKH